MKLYYVGSLISVHTKRWIRYFAQRGNDVCILSPVKTYDLENVKVETFKSIRTQVKFWDMLLNAMILIPRVVRFRSLIRRMDADILHVHYVNDAALCAALTGYRPLVVTAWGSDILIGPRQSWSQRQVVRFVLRKADLITCDAKHMKEALVELGADRTRINIIHFGTDTERFKPQQPEESLREELGLDTFPTVISLRRLEPLYDVESLVQAVPLVLEKCPDAKFIVAGTGSQYERLQQMAASLKVSESIRFVGQISDEELPRYLAASDIYVSTALSDAGVAASTAEAMACCLPVVITDVAENRDWIEDGVSGFLVSPRNPHSLAMRIIRLLECPGEKEQMGRRGRQVIIERNDWSREMAKMACLYQKLADEVKRKLL